AVRRMDRDVRFRAPDRRAPRPAHPPRQHPRDERRELSPGPEPGTQSTSQPLTETAIRVLATPARATPSRRSPTPGSSGLVLLRPMDDFYAAVDRIKRKTIEHRRLQHRKLAA